MTNYIDAPHIQELIEAGVVSVADPSISKRANEHLETSIPLLGYGTIVDWSRLKSTTLLWMTVPDEKVVAWARSAANGMHDQALLLFSPYQPCLIGTLENVVANLDTLVWGAAGPRIVFGIELNTENGEIRFSDSIIEFDGSETLFAVVR